MAIKDNKIETLHGVLPPQAIELEEAVLGALMIDNEAINLVYDVLKPTDFYKPANSVIYDAICNLFAVGDAIDMLTVTQTVRKMGKIEMVGGTVYIMRLTNRVSSSANIETHARQLSELAIKREIITQSNDILRKAFEPDSDAFELLANIEKIGSNIGVQSFKKGAKNMLDFSKDMFASFENGASKSIKANVRELDNILGGMSAGDFIILAARPAMGKCLGKGTKVLMFDGSLKEVENIKVGDVLMGNDSTPRNVISLARGREMMYWVHQKNAMSYRVNESHILSLRRSRAENNHKNGDILNISVSKYLKSSDKFKNNYKGYKSCVNFETKELSISPYFLGVWIGDGTKSNTSITNVDIEVLEYLESYANELGLKYSKFYDKRNGCITSRITSINKKNTLLNKLKKYNLINNKHIPDDFIYNSIENRLYLLAGIIDSDGYYCKKSNSYEIRMVNEKLIKQIKFICDTLGFNTSFSTIKARIKSTGFECDAYRLRFNGNANGNIIPIRVNRRKQVFGKNKKSVSAITLEKDIVDDYYGFEIDGNKLFLLEDMTVTHNTTQAMHIARQVAMQNLAVGFISLEMTGVQLSMRNAISEYYTLRLDNYGSPNVTAMRMNTLTNKEKEGLQLAISQAPHLFNLHVNESPFMNFQKLASQAREWKRKYDIQFLVIDYLQLVKLPKSKQDTKTTEIEELCYDLKALAKELDLPILALSQLSREVEKRGDKRPQLSDLRDSGGIEQSADSVIFLYRPEYYGFMQDEAGNSTQNLLINIIAKNRNGQTGDINLFVDLGKNIIQDWQGGIFSGVKTETKNDTPQWLL